MNEQEKLEMIGLRASYNYFFDNLYSDGYEVIYTRSNPEEPLSDFIDAAYDAKGKADILAGLEEPNKLTIDTNELPTWANWIARDADGELWVYEYTPTKEDTYWAPTTGEFNVIDDWLSPSVKWTDPQPTKID